MAWWGNKEEKGLAGDGSVGGYSSGLSEKELKKLERQLKEEEWKRERREWEVEKATIRAKARYREVGW